MKFSSICLEINEQIAKIWVDRPKVYNALNEKVLDELIIALDYCSKNNIKVLIFCTKHEKAFVAGADILEMEQMSKEGFSGFLSKGNKITKLLESSRFISIAAVHGYALGGGFELALACNFIFTSDKAIMGFPETKLGIIPGFGGTQRLLRAVGYRKALELVASNTYINAQEAKNLHITNDYFIIEELETKVSDIAHEFSKMASGALYNLKQSVYKAGNLSLNEALKQEQNYCLDCFDTEEQKEGMRAFIEKREARFN